MKTKYWIALLVLVLAICVGLSIALFLPGKQVSQVQVYSEGKLMHTLSLDRDTQITVQTRLGANVITVRDGKVAVTEADCPDHHCMHRGWCDGGAPIVCLPNRLELRFTDSGGIDAALK